MQKKSDDLLTIGQIAQRSGLAISAIRFYEEKGLISSLRTNGNQRRYARYHLRRLALLKVAQNVGLSLQEIQQAFTQLPLYQAPSKQDWEKLSQQWQAQLIEKIRLLENMHTQLDQCIGCGCLSLQVCPLRNPEDIFAIDPEAYPYWEEN